MLHLRRLVELAQRAPKGLTGREHAELIGTLSGLSEDDLVRFEKHFPPPKPAPPEPSPLPPEPASQVTHPPAEEKKAEAKPAKKSKAKG